MDKPFGEQTYHDDSVFTFAKGPAADAAEYWTLFPANGTVLDVGCGERRNAIFLAEKGLIIDAFDISEAGIEKAKRIVATRQLDINSMCKDLVQFVSEKVYGIIFFHGVLHLASLPIGCQPQPTMSLLQNRFLTWANCHPVILTGK